MINFQKPKSKGGLDQLKNFQANNQKQLTFKEQCFLSVSIQQKMEDTPEQAIFPDSNNLVDHPTDPSSPENPTSDSQVAQDCLPTLRKSKYNMTIIRKIISLVEQSLARK